MAEREDKGGSTSALTRGRRLCPFVSKPFNECFCSDTGSASAEAAIRVCGGDFENCEIYKRMKRENKPQD
jgi:adenosylmethionine-8-amino-7-oxononanoate aminotransferase